MRQKINALIGFEFVDLLYVDRKPSSGVQTTRAEVTLEMLGFLVLH